MPFRSFAPRPLRLLPLLLVALAACGGDAPTSPGNPGNPGTPGTPGNPSGPAPLVVPELAREFRGLWVATVANIDWPSRTGLTPGAAQTELLDILDRARSAGLNAVVLQVRAAGDALYPSALEPWSRSLTGTQGGDPGWDPLAFAVEQAHQRGLELHAWFNPFRAGNTSDTARLAPNHFWKRRPDIARIYCSNLWFDPSATAVHDQAIAVVTDVVRRYGVDAVHLDDYFYPYPDSRCPGLAFPDSAAFAAYRNGGGTLTVADWRRDNVNRFVERLYREAHAVSPTVRVGISPFGIWRPGNPAGITGLDSYASIYADSRLWLQRGWVDYFAPQLYWSIASTGQSFTALLDWWTAQNTQRRHLWPGLAAYRVLDGTGSAFASSEIVAQVAATRQRATNTGGPSGTILYNTTSVMQNRDGLTTALGAGPFATPALVPATPWLDAEAPGAPTLAVVQGSANGTHRVTITPAPGELPQWWVVRWRSGTAWSQRLQPSQNRTVDVPAGSGAAATDGVVVNAVDRVGNVSAAATWRPQ
jgi:uncharacterized lipoprotein YddW (UPF0748 family)